MSAQQVLIVGQSYVGLPLAMRAVEAGFDVTGLDLDEQKIKRLLAGESYIDDIPDTRLRATLDSGRYTAIYPGTTDELVAPILEAGSGLTAGVDFHLGYFPERIDPGNPTWTLENTPKVVSGINAASPAKVKGSSTRSSRPPSRSRPPVRPSSPSCSRTRSATSTSPWSTSWRCSPTTWASTSGKPSTPPPPSPSGS